ncbi:cell wall metabolism sensor histidine kinase WalK [Aeromicrobium sp. Leaf350]|uniref:sensor histidine kinase n=1 Tax=Aeromicrobium sp. Leaf350 TaxID=2876565 RepID=UPI001E4C27F1|nr:ATP-binding protein [Aeromicrobium sp. Leaf350]
MTRLLPATLTGRLIVTIVALVALVGVGASALTAMTMQSHLTDRLDSQLHDSLDRSTREFDLLPDGPRPPSGEPLPVAVGQGEGTLTAVFLGSTRRGDVIGDGEQTTLPSAVLDTLADVPTDDTVRTVDLGRLGSYRVLAVQNADGLIVVGGLPTDEVDETIQNLLIWEVVLTLAGVVVAAATGRVLVRRQLRPLRDVAATAHEVASMPLSSGAVEHTPRVPVELTDRATEVGRVGDALNVMLDHVESSLEARHESEQQVRQFVADASHELRTPLSTIAGYTELVHRSGEDPEVVRQALAKIETESSRMSALVNDLLLLARLDSGRPLEKSTVDLTQILLEAVSDRQVVDPERRWNLQLPDDAVEIPGDAGRLHQAVTNLLTNASRHTPEGTTVSASLRTTAVGATVTVRDDGPGLEPELVPHVFDRFTRGDSSRTRASGGAGLGTSLVKAIVEAHGGQVAVRSRPGDTAFTLSFPA